MKKLVECRICYKDNHWTYQCFKKPIKKTKPVIIKRKRIVPKIDQQWVATKKQWFKANPPLDSYYYCHYCHRVLVKNDEFNDYGVEYVTLDHKVNRHNKALKYDLDNLVPCCFRCNSLKGSRSYENFCREHAPHLLELDSRD